MNLYVMRHGETEWNKQRLIQGAADIPLTEYGEELARLTGDGFAADGIRFQVIFTSPMIRARRTAEIINENDCAMLLIDGRLRELNFGKYEGTDYRGIDENIRNCLTVPSLYRPDPTAESFEDFFARIRNFLNREIRPLQADPDLKNILIVCHGAVIRALFVMLRGMDLDDFWTIRQPNCSVNQILLENDTFTIVQENMLYYKKIG